MSIPEPPGTPDPWQPPAEGVPPPPPPPPSGGFPPSYPPSYPAELPPELPTGGATWTYSPAPRSSGKATAVMVLGIVGLVMSCGWGIGIVPAIVALALAPGAKREIAASGGVLTGDGFVKAGVICSWITVGLVVVGIVAFIAALALGQATDATFESTSTDISVSGVGVVGMLASLPLLTPTLRRLRP